MTYNGSVETMYLDPVSFVPNQRCAFELDGTKLAYGSNMRLLNLGVVSNTAQDYSQGLGAMALIRNIRLMDARTELSGIRNVAPYMFFKNCNRTNATNKSEDSYLKRNQLGFEIAADDNKVSHTYSPGRANTTPETTELAYLDLREVFPILNELTILPTSIFKNLRIEIEFDGKASNQILGETDATFDIQRPILAVDVQSNPVAVQSAVEQISSAPIMWQDIEQDNYTMNAVDTSLFGAAETATQTAVNQSLGFKGKFVERLLITKQIQNKLLERNGASVLGFGALASSQAILNEKVQINLNGNPILPGFQGMTKPNEILGMLSDEWGSINAYPGSNLYEWSNTGSNLDDANTGGQQSFICVRLGARVAQLQTSISRTNNRDTSAKAATNAALNINLYGEVSKMLNVTKSGYRVVYA
tara:strand:+ start:3726 stop:4976 length:1251 start_codon:yes stop_codon:yes gene_type:complete